MQAPLSPVPPGLIVNEILRDYPRSLEAEWTMKPLPSLPERDTITLSSDQYEVRQ